MRADKWEIMIIYSNGIEHGKKKKTLPKGRERLENNLLIILKEQAKAEKILAPDQFELFIACSMFYVLWAVPTQVRPHKFSL